MITKDFNKIFDKLALMHKGADCELNFNTPFELLVAVILSAQCTDKRVNLITPTLFERYPDTKSLAIADIKDVKNIINSCSFFNNKAKNIIDMAKRVEDVYGGVIPMDEKELITLGGVGQKTANVVMIEYTGANLMAVDTHVFRVSHRLGLSDDTTASKTEATLVKKFKNNLRILHQGMVLFGRYICKAKNPKCDECFLTSYCKTKESFKV